MCQSVCKCFVCCHLFTGCMFCSALSWPGCQMKWTTTTWLSFPCWSECRTPKVGTGANIKMHLVNVSWSPHWSIHCKNLHTFTNSVLCCLSCSSSEAVMRSCWLELCYKLRPVKFWLVSVPEQVLRFCTVLQGACCEHFLVVSGVSDMNVFSRNII